MSESSAEAVAGAASAAVAGDALAGVLASFLSSAGGFSTALDLLSFASTKVFVTVTVPLPLSVTCVEEAAPCVEESAVLFDSP